MLQSATDALRTTSKRIIQKAAEATGNMIDNKIADKTTKIRKTCTQMSMIRKYLMKDIYL